MNPCTLLGVIVAAAFAAPLASPAHPGGIPARLANYARPFETPTRPALIPLPSNAIEPTGWLRDWCETARDGYTGHMDEINEEFRKSWAADYTMTGDNLAYWWKGAWPYEGGGYWFDGLFRLGQALRDGPMTRKARARLDVVVDHMNPNSILFMWWLDRNRAADLNAAARQDGGEAQEWPMWTNGFMGRTLANVYATTRDPRALRALETAYSGDPTWIYRGFAMTNVWPALEAYTWSGNPRIGAALTDLFARNKIIPTSASKPVRLYESWYNRMPAPGMPWYTQPDHTVHFNESVIPWVVGYLWTGERGYLKAAMEWYDLVERGDGGMQPQGVPVGDENCGPTGSFRGTETCNVASFMWSQLTLLRVAGEARMADRVERAFFNAAPSAVTRDLKGHVYDQAPNRISPTLPPGGGYQYQPTHWPLCCTASLNRMLPYYVGHMWMATYDNGLAATHYGPCKVTALVANGRRATLACRTDYPFRETISITVGLARPASFPLAFRIPGWCARPSIAVDGRAVAASRNRQGFVRVARRWRDGDTVELRFPMAPRVRLGHDNDAADTPYATVSYGPLLFALPIPDTADANTAEVGARWQYALDTGAIQVKRGPMPRRWSWQLNSPLKLTARAQSFDWQPTPRKVKPVGPPPSATASPFQAGSIQTILPAVPVPASGTAQAVSLVPFGCTKFRVAMFPVTDRLAAAHKEPRH